MYLVSVLPFSTTKLKAPKLLCQKHVIWTVVVIVKHWTLLSCRHHITVNRWVIELFTLLPDLAFCNHIFNQSNFPHWIIILNFKETTFSQTASSQIKALVLLKFRNKNLEIHRMKILGLTLRCNFGWLLIFLPCIFFCRTSSQHLCWQLHINQSKILIMVFWNRHHPRKLTTIDLLPPLNLVRRSQLKPNSALYRRQQELLLHVSTPHFSTNSIHHISRQ